MTSSISATTWRTKNNWWNCDKRPHTHSPEFALHKTHPHDSNRHLSRVSKVDPSDWKNAPANAKDVVELRLKIHELMRKAGLDLAAGFASELAEWMEGPRHRIVHQAAVDLGGDSLAISIFHVGFVTHRMDATDPGKKWLFSTYQSQKDLFVAAFFKAIEKPETVEEKWYKPVKKATKATMNVVKNFIGVIHVVHRAGFENVIRHTFCKQIFGIEWKALDPKKVPKLWGKPILNRVPTGILVPTKGFLGAAKEKFEKYKVAEWFEGIGLAFEVIDVCLTLHKVMSEETNWEEKLKAAFETTGVAISLVKFNLELEKTAAAKAAGKSLSRIGGAIGVFTGFIEFDVTVSAGLQAYYMDGNYRVAALQGVTALTVGGGIIVGALGVLAGEAATPVIGWIAFALTALGLGIAWLVSKLQRNKWEEVARYSYLGKYYADEDGEQFYKDYFNGASTGFWKDCRAQQRALIALMSGFRVETERGKAIYGEIEVHPLYVQAETKFLFVWLFTYRRWMAGEWMLFEVKVEAQFTVADFQVTSKCEPATYTAEIEGSVSARQDGSVASFTLSPRLAGKESWIPEKTLVLVQCQPDGSAGIEVPMDTEYEVKEGGGKRKYYGYVHGAVERSSDYFEASTD
jgi:hypothetical protein